MREKAGLLIFCAVCAAYLLGRVALALADESSRVQKALELDCQRRCMGTASSLIHGQCHCSTWENWVPAE